MCLAKIPRKKIFMTMVINNILVTDDATTSCPKSRTVKNKIYGLNFKNLFRLFGTLIKHKPLQNKHVYK